MGFSGREIINNTNSGHPYVTGLANERYGLSIINFEGSQDKLIIAHELSHLFGANDVETIMSEKSITTEKYDFLNKISVNWSKFVIKIKCWLSRIFK